MRFPPIHISRALIAIVLVTVTSVSADPPKKPSLMRYSKLWTNSPFTIKPTIEATKTESPLERDWMLGSIRPGSNGYSVTLINKKDRKNRVRLIPGFKNADWKIEKVEQDVANNENSRVQIRKGSQTAWITYDQNLIKVRPATVAKTSKSKTSTAGKSGTAQPPVPGRSSSNSSSNNKPRVRSVPRNRGR
ncbi:hypothetical protein JIN77_15910 [Verrucomicrobiaceae bacterium R5-34]|nr:hypothetical protein [Verrucomicrobiaceae bacterium R5-34]